MSLDATYIHRAVAAVCPILGVSIGNEANKATWIILFDPVATIAQRTAGQAAITAYDASVAGENARVAAQGKADAKTGVTATDPLAIRVRCITRVLFANATRMATAHNDLLDRLVTNGVVTAAQSNPLRVPVPTFAAFKTAVNAAVDADDPPN